MASSYGFIGPQIPPGHVLPGVNPAGMMNAMDPNSNNQPLQFNLNKGKPPMAIPGGSGEPDRTNGMNQMGQKMPSELMSVQPGMMGPGMPGFPPMMQGMPPNEMMMMNMQYQQYYGMGMMDAVMPQKEIIRLQSCVLYPPPPDAPPPSTRERPPGCRTIFIGGLPEKMTEEILREIFNSAGNIISLRLSKKNFAHIRFDYEEAVEKALYISGFRVKIEDSDEKENTGRIHVDYAQARDDLYEWECQQRILRREERHRMRLEEERLKPPSPQPVVHFTEAEASNLLEQIKSDEGFIRGTQVLITWLERGDCNRRNSQHFYSMIQSVNVHIRRLLNEKAQHDLDLEQMKLKFHQRLEGILRQLEQVENVFTASTKQKAWDHFTKAQRKNIDVWHKQAKETVKNSKEEILKDRYEDEMDMSDSEDPEGPPVVKKKKEENLLESSAIWQLGTVRDENKDLKFQLEAYKNEVALLKSEMKGGTEDQEKQIKQLKDALHGMQQQLINSKKEHQETQNELVTMKAIVDSNGEQSTTSGTDSISSSIVVQQVKSLDEREAKLIGLISTFLHVHPFGASVEYICSYLQRLDMKTKTTEVEELLTGLPSVFEHELSGVGAMLERRWTFKGFSEFEEKKES